MKDLNVYVEELLYKHQCVIIPKFGAFISNRKSAKLFEDKTFSPPKRELTFNASLNSNDGLLIKYISENSGVDYNLVEDYVNLAVEGWKRVLQQGESLTLDNIGLLKQTPEGRISFEAFEDVNYLTDSFGMSPFVPHEISEASDMKIPENQITPTLEKPMESQPEATNVTPAPNKQKGDENRKEKKRPFLKYTAVAVIGLGLLTFAAISFFGESVNEGGQGSDNFVFEESQIDAKVQQKLSEATFFQEVSVTLPPVSWEMEKAKETKESRETSAGAKSQATTTASVAQPKASEQPKTQTTVKESKKEITKVEASGNSRKVKKYQVMAGAFKEEKNAKVKVEQLHKLGFKDASVIGTNAKGLYQVSYAGFDNLSDAQAMQKEVKAAKESKKLEGGWILTND